MFSAPLTPPLVLFKVPISMLMSLSRADHKLSWMDALEVSQNVGVLFVFLMNMQKAKDQKNRKSENSKNRKLENPKNLNSKN